MVSPTHHAAHPLHARRAVVQPRTNLAHRGTDAGSTRTPTIPVDSRTGD